MKKANTTPPADLSREKYWNEQYVAYWKARVEESNDGASDTSKVITGDVKSSTNAAYLQAIGFLQIGKTDDVLELGCGFGRSLPALCGAARQVTAVDISEQMIAEAERTCQEQNVSFHVSQGESLPFADATFDAIVCFATFDAMYQTAALVEMSRLCRSNARVLITGKSDDYHDDDEAALAAEIGARAKGHPNYFTDVTKLLGNLDVFGFRLEVARYFARRGDFSRNAERGAHDGKFYEYMLVLSKAGVCSVARDFLISAAVSRTFSRREAAEL
jgi:ubiquinone/menaquinone biosynthesis C-methylase UbiE